MTNRADHAYARRFEGERIEPDDAGVVRGAWQASVGYLSELFGRFIRGFRGMAPLVLAVGCQAAESSEAPRPDLAAVSRVVERPARIEDTGPRPLGTFSVTFYYVIGEEEVVPKLARKSARPANDNQLVAESDTTAELASVAPPSNITLYAGKTCEPIAEVSRAFEQQLRVQGTGKLRDGRVVNIFGACSCSSSPCYKVIEQRWGTGGTGRALQPFRTVAVDPRVIKLGSLLYVPLLEGRVMPGRSPWGGFVHDGCVVADDTGGAIKDRQLDLFVGRKGWFLGMSGSRGGGSHAWARHVPVFDGSEICERKGRKVTRKSGSI